MLPDFGHTGSFFNEQPDAGTHLVNTYFDSGRVDVSRYQPQPFDFTPPSSHGAYATKVLATLLGLAVFTVLSLVVLAHRVRTRGRVGAKAAAVLRSVYPVVLGLGGWSFGALAVMTAMPGVRITSELMVVTAIAVPIGLGAYWAWVHRDWPTSTRRAGRAAVAAGALLGAWFGFHAAAVPLALLTATAAAVAGVTWRWSSSTCGAPSPPACPRPPRRWTCAVPSRPPRPRSACPDPASRRAQRTITMDTTRTPARAAPRVTPGCRRGGGRDPAVHPPPAPHLRHYAGRARRT